MITRIIKAVKISRLRLDMQHKKRRIIIDSQNLRPATIMIRSVITSKTERRSNRIRTLPQRHITRTVNRLQLKIACRLLVVTISSAVAISVLRSVISRPYLALVSTWSRKTYRLLSAAILNAVMRINELVRTAGRLMSPRLACKMTRREMYRILHIKTRLRQLHRHTHLNIWHWRLIPVR